MSGLWERSGLAPDELARSPVTQGRSQIPLVIEAIPPAHAPFRNASRRSLKAAPVRGTEWPAPGMIARSALRSRWRTSQIASNTELWPPEGDKFWEGGSLERTQRNVGLVRIALRHRREYALLNVGRQRVG